MSDLFHGNFFICILDDLRNNHRNSLYDLIKSAGLLRQLLMDGEKTLMDLANKPYKLKLRFCVRECQSELEQNHTIWWGRLLPFPHENQSPLKIADFLKAPVCIYNQHTYNVGDMIGYFSHFLGGIHSGTAKTAKEITFTKIHNIFPIINNWQTISLIQIIEVTIKGLEPLEAAIKGRTSTGGL